jgi:hypothetical protein
MAAAPPFRTVLPHDLTKQKPKVETPICSCGHTLFSHSTIIGCLACTCPKRQRQVAEEALNG